MAKEPWPVVVVCVWAEPSSVFSSSFSGQEQTWRKERRETLEKEACRSHGQSLQKHRPFGTVLFFLFCTLYILVFSGLVKNPVPSSYCRVCDLTFHVSTVSCDCVFYLLRIYTCIFICWRVPDSRGHVMHYLFRFLSSRFSSERTNPFFPDVWSRTQNSLFNLIWFDFILYHDHFFCVLFHCRRIATYFKSIG